jgi:hypothetical protein
MGSDIFLAQKLYSFLLFRVSYTYLSFLILFIGVYMNIGVGPQLPDRRPSNRRRQAEF